MQRMVRGLVWLAALVILTSSAAAAGSVSSGGAGGLKTLSYGKPPPDFWFDLGAGSQDVRGLVGRPVVINFWATWCEPCALELGAFDRLRATYGERVRLLTVSDEAPDTVRDFLAAHGFDLPFVDDPDRNIFKAYSVTPLPATVIVAKDGTVSRVIVGAMEWKELAGDVDAELAR